MSEEEIAQYNQCSEDWRHYNNTIWQMPVTAITVASAIIAIAYQFINEALPRTVTLFFGSLVLLGLTIALIKHRLFQNQRTDFLDEIEMDWIASKKIRRLIGRKTKNIKNVLWYQKLVAYNALLHYACSVCFCTI
jgi:hypothetical protein